MGYAVVRMPKDGKQAVLDHSTGDQALLITCSDLYKLALRWQYNDRQLEKLNRPLKLVSESGGSGGFRQCLPRNSKVKNYFGVAQQTFEKLHDNRMIRLRVFQVK